MSFGNLWILLTLIDIILILLILLLKSIEKNDEQKEIYIRSRMKIERYNRVVRTYRNSLMMHETHLYALPAILKEEQATDFIKVRAKLELINQIEKD